MDRNGMNHVQDGEGHGYYNDDKAYYSSSSSSQGYNGRKLSSGSNSSPSKRDQHQRVSHQQQQHQQHQHHHHGRNNSNTTNGDDSLINSAVGAYASAGAYHHTSASSSMKTPMRVNNKRNTNTTTASSTSASTSSSSSNHSQRKISSTSTTSSGSASISPSKGSSSRRSAGAGGSRSSQSPPSHAQEAPKYKCLDCHESFVKWSHCLTHLRQAQHCPDKIGTPEGRRELQNLCMLKKDSVATNFSLDDDFIAAAVAAATLSENNNSNSSHSRSGRGGRMDDVDDENLSRKLSVEPPSPLLSATDMSEFSVMMPVSLSPTVAYAVDSAAQVQWSQRYGISQMQPLNQYGSQQTPSPSSNQHISWIPSSIGLKHHGVRSSSPGFSHQYAASGQNSSSPSSVHIPSNGYSQNHSPLSPTSLQQQQQQQHQQQQLPRPLKTEVNNLLARERRSYSLEEPRGRGLSTSSYVSSPGDMVHADYIKMNAMPAQGQGNITYKYFCPTCTQPFQKWSHCLQHLRQSEHFGLLGSDNLRKIQALCAIDVRGLRSEFASPASRMDSPQLILQHKYYISNIMRGHYSGDQKSQPYHQPFHPYQQQDDYDESGDVLFALKSDKLDFGPRGDRKAHIRPNTLQGLPDKVAYLVNSFLNVDDMYNLFLALSKNDDLEFATSSRVRTWSGNTVTLSDDDDASFMGYE